MIEEVARHYGYDRLGKTVPKSTVHGSLSVRQQRRRQLRQVLLGLGISEAMPNPFLAPDTLARAGLDGPTIRITNPLIVEESVLRTSLRPGLLEAIAYNESHRRSGVALFEIGHVYPPGDGELPDEYEALSVVLAGREAPAAIAVWREISERWASVPASIRVGCHPGCTPHGRQCSRPANGRPARSVRSTPPCCRDSTSTSGWRSSNSTSTRSSTRAEADRLEADQPDAVERSRSGVRAAMTTCRPRSSSGRFARASAICSSTSSCSTCSAGRARCGQA